MINILKSQQIDIINTAKLNNLNFHLLEVVSRFNRDPQLQVGENYSYLFYLKPHIIPHHKLGPNLCSHKIFKKSTCGGQYKFQ